MNILRQLLGSLAAPAPSSLLMTAKTERHGATRKASARNHNGVSGYGSENAGLSKSNEPAAPVTGWVSGYLPLTVALVA
jgi:hypothetical protein